MPIEPGGEDLAFDFEFARERPDETRGIGCKRDQFGHRLTPFCNHDPVRVHLVEQGQALRLKLRGRDVLHDYMIRLVIMSVHFVAVLDPDGSTAKTRAASPEPTLV